MTLPEWNTREINGVIAALLNCKVEELSLNDYGPLDAFYQAEEEVYELPPGSEIIFEVIETQTPSFVYGYFVLFKWKGREYVGVQDASPFEFYSKIQKDDNG